MKPSSPEGKGNKSRADECATNFSFPLNENWAETLDLPSASLKELSHNGKSYPFKQKRFSTCSHKPAVCRAERRQQCLHSPVVWAPRRTSVFLFLSLYRKGRGAAPVVRRTSSSEWCNGCHSTGIISPISGLNHNFSSLSPSHLILHWTATKKKKKNVVSGSFVSMKRFLKIRLIIRMVTCVPSEAVHFEKHWQIIF